MRRTFLFSLGTLTTLTALAMLVTLTTAGSAQTLQSASVRLTRTGATADHVVARLMTFDRDRDGRIAPGELVERMEPVVARGDTNGDGMLDRDEIRRQAVRPVPPAAPSDPFLGGYAFGDEVGFSSRLHIEGAIDDLRLPQAVRDDAQAAATAFLDAHEAQARTDLLHALEGVLSPTQLLHFQAMLDTDGGERVRLVTRFATATGSKIPAARAFLVTKGLAAPIRSYELEPIQQERALTAVETFEARHRLRDADRAALLDTLAPMLSEEERDDLRAALERRPVVSRNTHRVAVRVHAEVVEVVAPAPAAR